MPIDEALPIILAEMNAVRSRTTVDLPRVGLRRRLTAMDIFEIMVRIDDLAIVHSLSGSSSELDRWALNDCAGLVRRLNGEPGSFLLAVLLTISPHGLAQMASQLSLFRWMEVARALNGVTENQFRALHNLQDFEDYLTGATARRPKVDLPYVFPLPAPSVLRIVQGFKFRFEIFKDQGYQQAMKRYIRFFC